MSLIPILQGTSVAWRTEFVIEHMVETRESGAPTFCAVRTSRYKYIMYSGGDEELYDLQTDPYELQNLAGVATLAGVKAQLRADDMKLCTPRPPGWMP
jgi:hypothetical protein